jgi:hypothetical protein
MTDATTNIFRASLRAKLYRDIEIPSDRSLYDLGEAIARSYGFDLDHAFGFFPKLTGNIFDAKPGYELFADMGEGGDSLSVKKTTVAQAVPKVGKAMTFLFDYGDEWRFRVEALTLGERELLEKLEGAQLSWADKLKMAEDLAKDLEAEATAHQEAGMSEEAYGILQVLLAFDAGDGADGLAERIAALYADDAAAPPLWQEKEGLRKSLRQQVRGLAHEFGLGNLKEVSEQVEEFAALKHFAKV